MKQKHADSIECGDVFEEFVRQVYLTLQGRGVLSQRPVIVDRETVRGVIPFDTEKYTVCIPFVERHVARAPNLHGWKRLEFDRRHQAAAFIAECRLRGQRGMSITDPVEAADFNKHLLPALRQLPSVLLSRETAR